MNQKIIFFDIDGTILDEKTKLISDSTKRAIKKVRENGHYAIINTGRTGVLIDKEIKEEIGFDGYVLGCGTSIIFRGKRLFHQVVPEIIGKSIIKKLRDYKIDAVLEGEKHSYTDAFEKMHSKVFRKFIKEVPLTAKSWDDEKIEFDKLFLMVNENSDFEQFQKELEKDFDFIDRKKGFYEALPKGVSKASGIKYLVEHLGMSMGDTVAIGDSCNDLSMLSAVHTSIAMGNSVAEVLTLADYITTEVGENGIENALIWLGVI